MADFSDYKTSNNKGFRYIFILIDNFSKYFRTISLKNKNRETTTEEFSNNLTTSKRSPIKLESDQGAEFCNSFFQTSLRSKFIQLYSRFTDKGPSIAERVIRTERNLLKKPLFEKGNADWLSELPSVNNRSNNTIHQSTKKTPNQASKKINEKEVYSNLKDKSEIQKPKFKLGQLVRTTDIKRVFSNGDSTNWSYKFYTIKKITHDTIPNFRINYLLERSDEKLVLPSEQTLEQNNQVMKEQNLIQ